MKDPVSQSGAQCGSHSGQQVQNLSFVHPVLHFPGQLDLYSGSKKFCLTCMSKEPSPLPSLLLMNPPMLLVTMINTPLMEMSTFSPSLHQARCTLGAVGTVPSALGASGSREPLAQLPHTLGVFGTAVKQHMRFSDTKRSKTTWGNFATLNTGV